MDKTTLKAVAVVGGLFAAQSALAAGGITATGTEFDSIYDKMVDWVGGGLGKTVAVAFVLIGVIGGIARQSIMALGTGIAGGIGLGFAPSIVDSTITATTEKLIMNPEAAQALTVMTNGLL